MINCKFWTILGQLGNKIIIIFFVYQILFPNLVYGGLDTIGEENKIESMIESGEPIVIYADFLEHREKDNLIIGDGYVDVKFGDLRLQADHIEFNTETKEVIAVGNVILDEGEDRLMSERMEVALQSKTGVVYKGQGFVESYYFWGEKIEKLGEGEYRIYQGRFTSCEQPIPDWQFKSPDTLIQTNNYIFTKHPSMWVKKVPILYIPYAVFPIKRDRATGLLVPSFKYRSTTGYEVKNAFFWAIKENMDATYSFDYIEEKGIGQGLEYRYIFSEDTEGIFDSYYIKEKDTEVERWDVNFKHKQGLPWDVKGLLKLEFISDKDYAADYEEDLEDQSEETLSSYLSLTKNWAKHSLVLSAERTKDLEADDRYIIQKLPELSFMSVNQQLGSTPFFFKLESSAVSFEEDDSGEKTNLNRADFYPQISLPLDLGDWLTMTPAAGYRETWYSENVNDDNDVSRQIYDAELKLDGPKISRIFNTELLPRTEKIKHLIEPRISYNYIPEVDQSNLLQFDSVDTISEVNEVTYSLTNKFYAKRLADENTGEQEIKEIIKLSLSQSYDINEVCREEDLETTAKEPFSDVSLDLETKLLDGVNFGVDGNYDIYDDRLNSLNMDLKIQPSASYYLEGGRRYDRDSEIKYLTAGAGIKLFERWDLSYSGKYDKLSEEFIESKYAIIYESQCWDIKLSYIDGVEDYEYQLTLSLKNIGTTLRLKEHVEREQEEEE